VREAEEAAQRTLQQANDEAAALTRDAELRAAQVVADAEAEARRAGEEARQQLVAEIIALEESRDALRADSGILERHLDEQRLRLRSSVSELQRLLDDPSRLRVDPAPTLAEVSRPPAVAEALAAPATDAVEEPIAPEPALDPVASAADDEEIIDLVTNRPLTGGVTFTAADDVDEAFTAPSASEDEAWARFVGDDDGPPTQAIELGDADDDAYLTELRKAMVDDSGELFAPDAMADDRQRLRFGRRR
jgi:hypothetical protein